ncbi:Flavin-dependent oxidoreductase, luciferase family (includes alkanesulfonate monooxygenase SsuD and methylene tetrahydromethanopterin reductase) [Georgenia satyanarayanai]|uniref:Flavin-dependent oxidoreductase, luciferase family (Includes alkanesulfonate monooxygenase SsuD and methylene tetrahydromethanopterin reductase) n=1 Tax=Georgenia satyanarayanai TaxID=860221 RepID=A0A2Y9AQ02_9MICO|nr:LLM class flavin-dependent oxidoreductase [Georgenia satyanarayanai]PYF97365.1 alkanesulfonate monooxygenase SsuD/methylene tetrahydromethanopterin reductase-like flavin-dependent oxidoreductase (luciferase family) [Georgenia satyanarayanai]SSA46146.1 Flavin-dependent oxidoreductase, luciferase family (includes alkanesulfonate monooxygenase SsuD and methylene tetrahydromethanopterin reductase) [Georgenia satyanarayanai]
MRYGVVASFGSVEQVLDMAVAAEEAGWDGFFTWDGISVGAMDTYDPWTLLGAAAVSTTRIRLGAMVFALARRHPWKVAREAITVDHLSGGRLVMPVGLGAVDDGAFSRVSGAPTERRTRAELLDDSLAILDLAWRGEPFSYTGTHHRVEDLVFRPTPVQRPRVPVWVVGAWPSRRSMDRALRWDGVLPQPMGGPGDPVTPQMVADIRALAAERRADGGAGFDVVVEGVLREGDAAAASRVRELADAGATWWVESRWEGEEARPENLLARIRRGPPEP